MTASLNTKTIEEFMAENRLTKKGFCTRCKISVATYYRIMQNKDVNLRSLFKIAKTMGVPIKTLFIC